MNGRRPPADLDLRPWLNMSDHPADVVAVGFQEVVPLNANSVVMGTLPLSFLLTFNACTLHAAESQTKGALRITKLTSVKDRLECHNNSACA